MAGVLQFSPPAVMTVQKTLKTLLSIALAFGLVAMASPGEAIPISSYTGNSLLSNTGIDGTVNFAVFTSADFSTDAAGILSPGACAGTSCFKPGLSSPALDLGPGIYVYVYQVANNGTNSTSITNFSVGRDPNADVTSWGYFNGAVFTDAGGNVGATNNLDSGATSVGFFLDSGINPSLLFKASTSLQATLGIAAGGSSSLLVYTSHSGPGWVSSQINGGGVGAMGNGGEPGAQVPEPGTLLLTTMGLGGLVVGLRRRLYRKGEDR